MNLHACHGQSSLPVHQRCLAEARAAETHFVNPHYQNEFHRFNHLHSGTCPPLATSKNKLLINHRPHVLAKVVHNCSCQQHLASSALIHFCLLEQAVRFELPSEPEELCGTTGVVAPLGRTVQWHNATSGHIRPWPLLATSHHLATGQAGRPPTKKCLSSQCHKFAVPLGRREPWQHLVAHSSNHSPSNNMASK